MQNVVNWFEIPVTDMDRALRFYNTILATNMEAAEMMPGFQSAFFSHEGGVGGSLSLGEGYTPSREGTLVYLNGGDDLNVVLNRVEDAGGSIAMPKYAIGENGFIAIITDSEGNKIGLHSEG
jgi:predicted enzyme related to lactoylglutathione lyase